MLRVKNKVKILLSSLLILFYGLVNTAYADNTPKACIDNSTLGARILDYGLSLGFFNLAYNNFNMLDPAAEGATLYVDSSGNFTTQVTSTLAKDDAGNQLNRCNLPTSDIKFNYAGDIYTMYPYDKNNQCATGPCEQNSKDGWVRFRVRETDEQMCVQVQVVFLWSDLGCKLKKDNSPQFKIANAGCYVQGSSCTDKSFSQSKTFFPIAGAVVQCFKETMYKVFEDPCSCSGGSISGQSVRLNMFTAFQDSLRNVIRLALTLYVIVIGIKIALGGDMPKKGELFMYLMKFILVIYFSVGFKPNGDCTTTSSTIYQGDVKAVATLQTANGLKDFLLPAMNSLTSSLSNIIITSGGSAGLCTFNDSSDDYPTGFSFLRLWDSLDCRIAYYLGFVDPLSAGLGALKVGAALILSMIIPGLFSFQIIFALSCLLFAIFFISIVVYFVHLYLIAMFAVAVIIYLGPIFVPMALFKPTKAFFDGWMKLLISYALQPVIITAFIALMMTIFDKAFYADCKFTSETHEFAGKPVKYFYLNDASTQSTECKNSFGYNVALFKHEASAVEKSKTILFNYPSLSPQVSLSLLKGLLTMLLFSFLFYSFAEMLSDFAGELTGTGSIGGMAVNPTAAIGKAADLAKTAAKAAAGGKDAKASKVGAEKEGGGGDGEGAKATGNRKGAGNGTPGADG